MQPLRGLMATISDPAAPLAVGAGCATLLPKPPPVPAVVVISGAKENDEAGKAGGRGRAWAARVVGLRANHGPQAAASTWRLLLGVIVRALPLIAFCTEL